MNRTKTYQDIVHGAIQFSGKTELLNNIVRKLIDTPELQRLRYIRQNGLTNIVFHSMEHSRFAHSLGVAHVARRMYQRVLINSDIANKVDSQLRASTVIAALLHDIGHGPFSHTFEEIIHDIGYTSFSHEKMTIRMISENTKVNNILAQEDKSLPNTIVGYIDKNKRNLDNQKWVYKIVSSQLDADRLDYVLRDSAMAGLKNTTYDLSRIINFLYIHPDKPDALAISRHAIEAVESYLLALDQLYRVIYYHQAVRSASVILKLILKRSSKLFHDGDQSVFPKRVSGDENLLKKLFIKGENIDIEDYIRIMDAQIWVLIDEWCDVKDRILSDLCQRLISRDLFKSIIINDSYEAEQLKEKAVNLVSRSSSFISKSDASDYYVNVDVSKRKTYKQDDAIWLFEDGDPRTLQDDESSNIISVIRKKQKIEYLMFPSEIQDDMNRK